MSDPLRPLWDFDDLDATEARFRALQAEALTQLARVEGLRRLALFGSVANRLCGGWVA